MHAVKCLECRNDAIWKIQLVKSGTRESSVNYISCDNHKEKLINDAKNLQRPNSDGQESPLLNHHLVVGYL